PLVHSVRKSRLLLFDKLGSELAFRSAPRALSGLSLLPESKFRRLGLLEDIGSEPARYLVFWSDDHGFVAIKILYVSRARLLGSVVWYRSDVLHRRDADAFRDKASNSGFST